MAPRSPQVQRAPAAPRSRASGASVAIVLVLATVLVTDVVALAGAVRARREAWDAVVGEVQRRVELDARIFEAALSGVRADLGVLAAAAVAFSEDEALEDPVEVRRIRLERESALLLFAVGHPTLDEVLFEDALGVRSRVVRGEAEPFVIAPEMTWTRGPLELRVKAGAGILVARAGARSAGFGPHGATRLVQAEAVGTERAADTESGGIVASEPVSLFGWEPGEAWVVVRTEPRRELLQRVDALAAASRFTLFVHLTLVPLSLGLGILVLRAARRAARLAAEREAAETRRELERRMWHSERLASVGRLAAGLAHEINNPLAGATTWLALLEEDLAAGEQERAAATAVRLRVGLERIRDIVGSTLAFADPGRGESTEVDLGAVAAETAAFVGTLMPSFRVELGIDESPVVVRGDRPALGQLVLNLLLNSAQAQAERGSAALEVGRDGDRALLVVEDDGPGIPQEILDTLFEPFVSGRGSTGLGLSVCHGIVIAHGGRITGENAPRGGARFVVELPRVEAEGAT